MASAQIPGNYAIYIEAPSGARRLVMSASNAYWGQGGSSDGTIANTSEKWNTLPLSADAGAGGYKIVVMATTGAATCDASDAVWVIPIMVNGTMQTIGNAAAAGGLGNDNFTSDLTFGDIVMGASVPTTVAVYRAKENTNFRVGGGRVFLTLENNA